MAAKHDREVQRVCQHAKKKEPTGERTTHKAHLSWSRCRMPARFQRSLDVQIHERHRLIDYTNGSVINGFPEPRDVLDRYHSVGKRHLLYMSAHLKP